MEDTTHNHTDIGIQLFSLPKLLEKDFEGGIKMLHKMGYRELELYGPFDFSVDKAKEHWSAIAKNIGFSGSGYLGHSLEEAQAIFKQYDMSIPSIHADLDTMISNMEGFARAREILGFTYVTLPAMPREYITSDLEGYKKMSEIFNIVGESAKKVGLKFAYHNHGYGFQEVDGKFPIEVLFDRTDPELVFLELDVFWTIAGRANPVEYLKKYKGRYHMIHLKDMKPISHFSGNGSDPSQWTALFPKMTTAGDGDLDLEEIVKVAKETGVKHFFVEQDMVLEPKTALKRSIDYISQL